jgi:aminopeptidase N
MAGDQQAIAEAKSRFNRYLADPSAVSPSMVNFVIGTAGRYADAATYDAMAKRAMSSTNDEERGRLQGALASVQDPALASRTLEMALSSELPPHLAVRIVPSVAREHLKQAWQFAVEHRDALMKSQDALSKNRAFASIVGGSANAADADMMEQYVRQNFGPDALVEAQRVGNGVRIRAAQKARLLPQVRAALK